MHRHLISAYFLFLFYQVTISQQTAIFTNDLVTFNKALELYNNNQFLAAQSLFTNVKNQIEDESVKGDCSYYIANCAVRLNQQNADYLMEQFVEKYPASIKQNSAFINVANYYFENGKYSFARKWYDKVDENSLSRIKKDKFYFNNCYLYVGESFFWPVQTFFQAFPSRE